MQRVLIFVAAVLLARLPVAESLAGLSAARNAPNDEENRLCPKGTHWDVGQKSCLTWKEKCAQKLNDPDHGFVWEGVQELTDLKGVKDVDIDAKKAREILGLARFSGDLKTALKAFRSYIPLAHHPDKGGDEEHFKLLNAAFEKLKEAEKEKADGHQNVEIPEWQEGMDTSGEKQAPEEEESTAADSEEAGTEKADVETKNLLARRVANGDFVIVEEMDIVSPSYVAKNLLARTVVDELVQDFMGNQIGRNLLAHHVNVAKNLLARQVVAEAVQEAMMFAPMGGLATPLVPVIPLLGHNQRQVESYTVQDPLFGQGPLLGQGRGRREFVQITIR